MSSAMSGIPSPQPMSVGPCKPSYGVAQWLGRRSLACGLSPIYAWSMVDTWPLCGKCPLWISQPG